MSERGLEAARAGRESVLAVARSLTPEEWAADSDCAGWRVQDVITHMAGVCRQIAEPGSTPTSPDGTEATQDLIVAERKDWTPEQVLADYEEWSTKGMEALAGLQGEGIADTPMDLGDLGTHPLHLLANAIAFDHDCHLRHDILQPNGPVDREPPPADDLRLEATMEWLVSGLPQMSTKLAAAVERPIVLRLTGPGGGEWTIVPGDPQTELREGAEPNASATIVSSTDEFVLWGTGRRSWRERNVILEGDEQYAEQVIEAIHVF